MYYWALRIEKPLLEEKREKAGLPKGATAYLNIYQWRDDRRYWEYSTQEIKDRIQNLLKEISRDSINQEYTLERRERILFVKDYNSEDPIFDGEITLPDHLVDEKPGQPLDDDIL